MRGRMEGCGQGTAETQHVLTKTARSITRPSVEPKLRPMDQVLTSVGAMTWNWTESIHSNRGKEVAMSDERFLASRDEDEDTTKW